jgi:Fe-S oxidoreductase
MCRCECPVAQAAGREAVAPSGKARLAHLLLEGRLPWSEAALEALSACLGCRGCTLLCPFPELALDDELLAARRNAAAAGICLPAAAPFDHNLKKYGSPYGSRGGPAAAKYGDGEVLYFTGCTAAANHPAAAGAALALFEQAGVSYQTIDEYCCGYPAETWGGETLARQLAAENRARIAKSGARRLVTGCPECRYTFTRRYTEWGAALPLPVVDSAGFFLELVREGRLKPRALEGAGPVTYHDPCLAARLEEKWEEPRILLGFIPGLSLAEAACAKRSTRCCGGGRMLQLTFPALSEAIAKRRLAEFPAGAAVVTACPFCRENLAAGGGAVLDLAELLARACL